MVLRPKSAGFFRGVLVFAFGGFFAVALTVLPWIAECSVTSIRAGLLPGGSRIVIDLDRPSVYSLTKSGSELELFVRTSIEEKMAGKFPSNRTSLSYQAHPSGNDMIVRVYLRSEKVSVRHFPLAKPDRIVVDLMPGTEIFDGVIPAEQLSGAVSTVSDEDRAVVMSQDTTRPGEGETATGKPDAKTGDKSSGDRTTLGIFAIAASLVLCILFVSLSRRKKKR